MSSPERLREILTNKVTIPAGWEDAVASIPRELFLPDTIEAPQGVVSRDRAPERWLRMVYGDLPLITQINDGRQAEDGSYRLPTSSSSMPSIMLEMLELLDVRDGQRVLEVGAGTGYNAAWLAHRLGSGNVVSVEIDPGVTEQAAKNLQAAGYSPRVVWGEGERGWPAGAPYDRIVATFTVPAIPYAWVEQAPGGRIVAPWGASFHSHSFVTLDVRGGVAQGRFSGRPAFMGSRTRRPHRGFLADFLHHTDEGVSSRTSVNPLELHGDSDAQFYVGLALPDAWFLLAEADDGSGEATLWILADDRASWAAVEYVPGRRALFDVDQYGPRRLWDEVESALRAWEGWGRPGRDRAGLTIVPDGQLVWLDDPDNVINSPQSLNLR